MEVERMLKLVKVGTMFDAVYHPSPSVRRSALWELDLDEVLATSFRSQAARFLDSGPVAEVLDEMAVSGNLVVTAAGEVGFKPALWDDFVRLAEDKVGMPMGQEVKDEMAKLIVKEQVQSSGEAARAAGVRAAGVGVVKNYALKDAASCQHLADNTLYWVKTGAHRNVEPGLARTVQEGLDKGLGRKAIAENLRAELGHLYEVEASRWSVISSAAMNRARNFSRLREFARLDIETVRFFNPMDKRTSPVCFEGSTPIRTVAGERRIDQITPGMLVITGSGLSRPVLATSERESDDWISLRCSCGSHVTVTANHRILALDGWKTAGDLEVGDEIVKGHVPGVRNGILGRQEGGCHQGEGAEANTAIRGSTVGASGERDVEEYLRCPSGTSRVISTERLGGKRLAYNLTVADDPTYVAGGIVVHNCERLHGEEFQTRTLMEVVTEVETTRTPEAAIDAQPWLSVSVDPDTGAETWFKSTSEGREEVELDELKAAGRVVPPLHGNCRSELIMVSRETTEEERRAWTETRKAEASVTVARNAASAASILADKGKKVPPVAEKYRVDELQRTVAVSDHGERFLDQSWTWDSSDEWFTMTANWAKKDSGAIIGRWMMAVSEGTVGVVNASLKRMPCVTVERIGAAAHKLAASKGAKARFVLPLGSTTGRTAEALLDWRFDDATVAAFRKWLNAKQFAQKLKRMKVAFDPAWTMREMLRVRVNGPSPVQDFLRETAGAVFEVAP